MTKEHLTIAIDGPSGVGKSTLAQALAQRLAILHLDTGALYRALGLAALELGYSGDNEREADQVLAQAVVDVAFEDNRQLTRLNGQDVTHLLREDRVGMAASNISKFPQVREYLLSLQREIAASQSCVLDGRDIGSVVLPDADLKIFLTADPKIRAQRRWKELIDKGVQADLGEVEEDMLSRDAQDSGRKIAPTKQAVDAVLIDSGNLTIEESLDQVLALLKEKGLVL